MITLYDLAFDDDRRPSPFCWRAKFALAHKGLDYTNVPMGFTEKEKIAFADSKTVPVIQDGDFRIFFSGDTGYFNGFKRIGHPTAKVCNKRRYRSFRPTKIVVVG